MYFLEFYNNPLRQDVRYEAKLSSENIDIFRALSHQRLVIYFICPNFEEI